MKCAFTQTVQRYWTSALLLAALLSAPGVRADEDDAAKAASLCRPETHTVYTQPRGGHPGKSLRLVRVAKVARDACGQHADAPNARDGGREGG